MRKAGRDRKRKKERPAKLGFSLAVKCFILCRFDWAVHVICIDWMYMYIVALEITWGTFQTCSNINYVYVQLLI